MKNLSQLSASNSDLDNEDTAITTGSDGSSEFFATPNWFATDLTAGIEELDFLSFARKGGGGGSGGGGGGGILTTYKAGAGNGDAGYDIWIDFKGTGWTKALQDAFTHSADYLASVITDDIGGGGLYKGKVIDDLYVTAQVQTIDGEGGILGQAGPSATWTSNDLTAAGQMQFDIADALWLVSNNLWQDTVMHEFMHVLGFGSLWDYNSHKGLVSGAEYTGAFAVDAYNDLAGNSGATFIPVETDGGAGTAGAHWDEATLNNELMTGWINWDTNPNTSDNYLSKFSVMALADLGYTVGNYYDYPYDGTLIA